MVKQTYFDKIGKTVKGEKIKDILKELDLDYKVESQPILLLDGRQILDKFANIRNDSGEFMGIVGKHYKIIQNEDAFLFINDLIKYGSTIISGGHYNNGNGAFIIVEMPDFDIANEIYKNYIIFLNSFDGTGTIKGIMTPIRKVSNSAMVLSENSSYKISIKHSKSTSARISIASKVIKDNIDYMNKLKNDFELLSEIQINDSTFELVMNKLFDPEGKKSNILKARAEQTIEQIRESYNDEDMKHFKGTAFGILLAVSDYESHREPIRDTGNDYIYFDRVVGGMYLLNEAYNIILDAVGFGKRK